MITSCADFDYSISRIKSNYDASHSHLQQFRDGIEKGNRHRSNYEKTIAPSEIIKIGLDNKREISNLGKSIDDIDFKNSSSANKNQEYQDDYYDAHYQHRSESLNKSTYQGHYKVGNKYKIMGQTYYPREYDSLQEEGIASWYGPKFHGKLTANGEIFNMNDITAAHRTLPLPSVVRVTNLSNNRSAIVRVNDRGPFTHDRVIDLSKKSAEILGIIKEGTASVRVELLKDETKDMLKKLGLKK